MIFLWVFASVDITQQIICYCYRYIQFCPKIDHSRSYFVSIIVQPDSPYSMLQFGVNLNVFNIILRNFLWKTLISRRFDQPHILDSYKKKTRTANMPWRTCVVIKQIQSNHTMKHVQHIFHTIHKQCQRAVSIFWISQAPQTLVSWPGLYINSSHFDWDRTSHVF